MWRCGVSEGALRVASSENTYTSKTGLYAAPGNGGPRAAVPRPKPYERKNAASASRYASGYYDRSAVMGSTRAAPVCWRLVNRG
jgi:hypothetical protein